MNPPASPNKRTAFSSRSREEWIETTPSQPSNGTCRLSPLVRERSGLKRGYLRCTDEGEYLSPLVRERSGLKHDQRRTVDTQLTLSPLVRERSGLKPP